MCYLANKILSLPLTPLFLLQIRPKVKAVATTHIMWKQPAVTVVLLGLWDRDLFVHFFIPRQKQMHYSRRINKNRQGQRAMYAWQYYKL